MTFIFAGPRRTDGDEKNAPEKNGLRNGPRNDGDAGEKTPKNGIRTDLGNDAETESVAVLDPVRFVWRRPYAGDPEIYEGVDPSPTNPPAY